MSLCKAALSILALGSGLVSAFMWWKGSTIYKQGMEPFQHDTSEKTTYPYLERIGWWNKWAAIATALSVGLGAIANFVP
jgi:hypothetical protein